MQLEEYSERKPKADSIELNQLKSEAESILKQLGFSTHAARAFLAVSNDPLIPASIICEKTGIKDTRIYYALRELEEHGLLIRKEGNPNAFASQNLKKVRESLIQLLEKEHETKIARVTRLQEILGYFSLKNSQFSDDLEIQFVVRGFEKVKNRVVNLLRTVEREIVVCLWNEDVFSALREELTSLVSVNGIELKLALGPYLKKMEQDRQKNFLVTLTRKDLISEHNIVIIDNKKMITMIRSAVNCWGPPQWSAIITEDPKMVALGTSYFENPDFGIVR
jgi:sugar-specific transcriptional regulator TrmB